MQQIIVSGGHSLSGQVFLQGAKNTALPMIALSILTSRSLRIGNFPSIVDTQINLDLIRDCGGIVDQIGDTVIIDTANFSACELDPVKTILTTASTYFNPVIVRRFGSIITGYSGGDEIGGVNRFGVNSEVVAFYNALGISVKPLSDKKLEFSLSKKSEKQIFFRRKFFGQTIQALLFLAIGERNSSFEIINPSIEPEVLEIINTLNTLGADIVHLPSENKIVIHRVKELSGGSVNICSDPNELVTYVSMALATNSQLVIEGIDFSHKIKVFFDILDRIKAKYDFDQSGCLTIFPSKNELVNLRIVADFWPSECHTDWQQLLTPLLSLTRGKSCIVDNVFPKRFTSSQSLSEMGGRYKKTGCCLNIFGPTTFLPKNLTLPKDIRGASSILIAALTAKGTSVLLDQGQLSRGLSCFEKKLRLLGAQIEVQSDSILIPV